MPYLIVFAIACAVGVAVYAVTLRAAAHPATEPMTDPGVATTPAGPPTYLSDDTPPDWQTRLTGLLGLMVAVVVGGVALAATIYLSVSTGIRLFTR